jgi:hypothetical protein
VHTWPAWRGSARAADQARPREDFTELHREHHILALPPAKLAELKHLSMLSKLQQRGTASKSLESAYPKEEDQPDLPGEKAAGDSAWWSW